MSWDWDKLKKQQQEKRNEGIKEAINPKKKIDLLNNLWIIYPGYFLAVIILAVLIWFPVRWLHYKYGYESKVEQKIIEMVKPEYLKEEYRRE